MLLYKHVQAIGGCHLSLLQDSNVLILVANNIHMSKLTINLLWQLHASNVRVALFHLILSINTDIIIYLLLTRAFFGLLIVTQPVAAVRRKAASFSRIQPWDEPCCVHHTDTQTCLAMTHAPQ